MKKEQKLRKTNDFVRLYESGLRLRMSGLVFYFLKTTERVHRLGIVASRRTGSAVVRNKFRRRFRLLYSLLRNSLAQPHDAVVIATTPEAVGMDFLTLQSIFTNRLNKLIKIESDCC